MRITVIGSGNLGKSIINGLANSPMLKREHLTVSDKSPEKLEAIRKEAGVNTTSCNCEAAKASPWVLLCVQPRVLPMVLEEIRGVLRPDQVLISTVTGVSIAEINAIVPNKVIRVMPNTAARKAKSMSFVAGNGDLGNDPDLKQVQEMFRTIGESVVIEERLIQAATVLGASGIAFFLRYLRAMTLGGVQMGFHPQEAQAIAVQVALGAASLIEDGTPAEVEVDQVTTPMGCTIEGLNTMEHHGLSSAVISGLMAAYHRINKIT